MRNRYPTLIAASLLALLCALPTASTADGTIAEVKNAGDALFFYPTVETERLVLTVTGPCNYRNRIVVEKGELVFKLDDEVFDGSYSYSLMARPNVDKEIRAVMLEARETGDNRAVRRLCRDGKLPDRQKQIQTGSFTVLEGKIVMEGATEAVRRGKRDLAK